MPEDDPNVATEGGESDEPESTDDTQDTGSDEGNSDVEESGDAGDVVSLKDEDGWRGLAEEAESRNFTPQEFRQRVIDAQGLQARIDSRPAVTPAVQPESFPEGQDNDDPMTYGAYRDQRRRDIAEDDQRRSAELIKATQRESLLALNAARNSDKSLQDPLTFKIVSGLLDGEMNKGYSAQDAISNLTRDINRMKARGGKDLVEVKLKQKRRTRTEGKGGSSSGSGNTAPKPAAKPQDNDILGGHALERALKSRGLA